MDMSAEDQDDANWLKCEVSLKAGPFSGAFNAAFTTFGPVALEPKEVFRTFRKYRDDANQNSRLKWLSQAYRAALVLGAISGFAFGYWH